MEKEVEGTTVEIWTPEYSYICSVNVLLEKNSNRFISIVNLKVRHLHTEIHFHFQNDILNI